MDPCFKRSPLSPSIPFIPVMLLLSVTECQAEGSKTSAFGRG